MATAGRVLILPRGNYDENAMYEMLDVVSYNGSSWLAKKTSQGMIPCEENSEYWQNMVDIKVADNLTTKEKGMLLDASQGNVLDERISTEVTALLGKINTNKEATDAELKEVDRRLDEAESISKGRNPGVTFETYEEMVYAIDEMDENELKVGQNIYIADVGIPDLWIYSVEESKADFIYVSDEDIVSELEINTTFQVGYYKIAQLETQKVNLSEYAKQEDVEEIENQISEQNKKIDDIINGLGKMVESESGTFTYTAQPTYTQNITFARPFLSVPTVQATVLSGTYGGNTAPPSTLSATVLSVTQSGCVIRVIQTQTGSAVTGTVSWTAEAPILQIQ